MPNSEAPELRQRPIDAQIAEVAREIALRRAVYPTQIARAKMTQGEADEHMARMEGVMLTLKWVEKNAEIIKRVAKEGGTT